jgi:hypothetical protein
VAAAATPAEAEQQPKPISSNGNSINRVLRPKATTLEQQKQ